MISRHRQRANAISCPVIPQSPRPAPNEPGTITEQLAAVNVSLYLGQRRGTSAAFEWQDARGLVIEHARTLVTSDSPTDPRCSDQGRASR